MIMLNFCSFILLLLFCTSCTSNACNVPGAEANMRLAIALLDQGYTKEAMRKALLAQKLAPSNSKVWLGLGYLHRRLGEYDQAKKCYESALTIASKNGLVNHDYSLFLFEQGNYLQALKHDFIAVQDPEFLDKKSAYNNAALCAQNLGDYKLMEVCRHRAACY